MIITLLLYAVPLFAASGYGLANCLNLDSNAQPAVRRIGAVVGAGFGVLIAGLASETHTVVPLGVPLPRAGFTLGLFVLYGLVVGPYVWRRTRPLFNRLPFGAITAISRIVSVGWLVWGACFLAAPGIADMTNSIARAVVILLAGG